MLKRLFSTSVLVVLVFGLASGADAFTSDKRTYFTFNQPVALPGVTLPAGTYMFRLADETTTRKVIQVANREGTESFAMLHTMPAYRMDAPQEPEVRFMETAAGAPVAVRAWWYPGERTGYAFVYSKEQLEALARGAESAAAAAEPLAAPEESVAEGPLSGPDVIDGEGVPPEAADVEIAAEADVESQVAQAEIPQQPEVRPEADIRDDVAARDELPQTASPFPLLLLGGAGSALVGLRMLRRRS